METTFNLSRAIQNWRQALPESPAIRPDNLDELEAHLRDCITGFEAKGLSAEEGFFIDRALWMLAGMLFLTVGWDLSSTVSSALTYLGSTMSSNGLALGWLSVAGKFTTLGLVAAVFWRLATGRLGRAGIGTGRISRHPLLFAAATLGGVVLLKLAPSVFEMLSILNLAPHALGQTYLVTQWFNFVGPVIAVVLMAVLFTRLWRWRVNLQTGRRIAAWALILPLALALNSSSAHAQTNPDPGKSTAATKPAPAVLDQAMTLWRAGKQDEAAAKFLAVDFAKRPLFPTGSVLNYTEAQFIALPQAAREKMATQMQDDLRTLKEICAHIRDAGETAQTAGDKAKSEKCRAQLKACGDAFNQPDSLALLKLVGKALQKMAATAPKL
jgi:hypothetical protein